MKAEKLTPAMLTKVDKELLATFPDGSISLHGTSTVRAGKIKREGFKSDHSDHDGLWFVPVLADSSDSFGPLSAAVTTTLLYRAAMAAHIDESDVAIVMLITPNGYKRISNLNGFIRGDVSNELYIDSASWKPAQHGNSQYFKNLENLRRMIKENREAISEKLSRIGIPKHQDFHN